MANPSNIQTDPTNSLLVALNALSQYFSKLTPTQRADALWGMGRLVNEPTACSQVKTTIETVVNVSPFPATGLTPRELTKQAQTTANGNVIQLFANRGTS